MAQGGGTGAAGTVIAGAGAEGRDLRLGPRFARLASIFGAAWALEGEHRRFFLWLPVCFGAGIALYFQADREPMLGLAAVLAGAGAAGATALRHRRSAFALCLAFSAVFAGMAAAGFRSARLAAPVLERPRIATVQGFVEQIDFRRAGARFVLRVAATDGLEPARTPFRIRLTTRRDPGVDAGAFVEVKARLLPPSRAAQPGGYDFARDAFFSRIGAVGSVLGRIEEADAPDPPGLLLAAGMAVDRARNALARRVDGIVGGDAGAIAAAMVTGKRDLLSEEAKALIREAGIFHVITIAGVQMTLVAGIFFVGLRRLLALSQTLALHYPIKKWAAAAAILAAIGYDVMTGSRIGTERALFMTLVLLAAVLFDRTALTMRNLALAGTAVLLWQPEALLGASFQLSFAAVGALVAVYEARAASHAREAETAVTVPARAGTRRGWLARRRGHGLKGALVSTLFASGATVSFMAYDFHEMNPYVLIGNPLTLAIIEIFAVPGALLGTLLYPLGLDGMVWHWVGLGIAIIMAAARFIGALPGASLHLPAFAAWSLPFFALAVLSSVIWRTLPLKLTALPFALAGMAGAVTGPTVDVAVAGSGEAVAVREADGRLVVIGRRPSGFDSEQWLRADADGRDAKSVHRKESCDALGCTAVLRDGRSVALVLDAAAFAEDCTRAVIVVTPLVAPTGCAAPVIIDRWSLRRTGAVGLRATAEGFVATTVRASGENRPWSPAPRPPPVAHRRPGGSPAGASETDRDQ